MTEPETFPFAWSPHWKAAEIDGTGDTCAQCGEVIGPDQLGLWMPCYEPDGATRCPWHRLCLLRSVLPWHPQALDQERNVEREWIARWRVDGDEAVERVHAALRNRELRKTREPE